MVAKMLIRVKQEFEDLQVSLFFMSSIKLVDLCLNSLLLFSLDCLRNAGDENNDLQRNLLITLK